MNNSRKWAETSLRNHESACRATEQWFTSSLVRRVVISIAKTQMPC